MPLAPIIIIWTQAPAKTVKQIALYALTPRPARHAWTVIIMTLLTKPAKTVWLTVNPARMIKIAPNA